MALRRREQAAPIEYSVPPAVGEHAVLRTIPAMQYEIDRLRAENAVLRTLAYGDLAQDPLGTISADAPGDW